MAKEKLVLAAKLALARLLVSPPIAAVISHANPKSLDSMGQRIRLPVGSVPHRTRAMIRLGLYERAEITFVKRYLSPAHDVVELGASLGVLSAHISALLEPQRKLVSVEANPDLGVVWHGVMDGAGPGRRLIQAAVGAHDGGLAPFLVAADPLCSRVVAVGHANGTLLEISQRSLSALLTENDIDDDYWLVADIEGAEAVFILGEDQPALERCRGMIIELHDAEVDGHVRTWQEQRDRLVSHHGFSVQEARGPVLALTRDV